MATSTTSLDTRMSTRPGRIGMFVFIAVIVFGVGYVLSHLLGDLSGVHATSSLPFLLLGVALFIALGFEFVNGFHDTANAVATVIYTHSLEPHVAVVWSGTVEFHRRALVSTRRGGVRHHLAAAGRTDPAGGQRQPASRWCSRCWSRRSSGTSARGISDCRRRVRTR